MWGLISATMSFLVPLNCIAAIDLTQPPSKVYKVGVLMLPAPYAVEMEIGFKKLY